MRGLSFRQCCAASLVRQITRYGQRYYCGHNLDVAAERVEIVAIAQYMGRDASAFNSNSTAELWEFTVSDETWATVLPLVRSGRCCIRAVAGDMSRYLIDPVVPSEPLDPQCGRKIKTEKIK